MLVSIALERHDGAGLADGRIASVRVYPGANGSFTLFQDEGNTYGYETGMGLEHKNSRGMMQHTS